MKVRITTIFSTGGLYYVPFRSLSISKLFCSKGFMGGGALDFCGPLNGPCFARGHFRAHKSLEFQGPSLLLALEMDVARIKITSSRAI